MTPYEAKQFIANEIEPRWPGYELTGVELRDWAYWLRPFDAEVAERAISEVAARQDFSQKPNLAFFRKIAAKYQPCRARTQPEPTMFVLCMGKTFEGVHPQPGYFLPVITPVEQNEGHAAEWLRKKMEAMHGGEWRVFENVTHLDMMKLRCELQGREWPQDGESWKTFAARIGHIPQPKGANEQVRELLASERKECTCESSV